MTARNLGNIAACMLVFASEVVAVTKAFSSTYDRETLRTTPTPDPLLANQDWFKMLNLGSTWNIATGKGVLIAACAPGYYTDEPELSANFVLEARHDFADLYEPNRVNDGKYTFHGTASAAIMVAAQNGFGTNGIAFDALLIPLQNFNYLPDIDDISKDQATANCVAHVAALGAVDVLVVLNQTPDGSSETAEVTRDAISQAVNAGIVVVSSAGDSSKELRIESEMDTGSIMVGAVRRNGSSANFSNWGKRVNISAVGESVLTLGGPNGTMRNFGGTAAATAQVAGVVALIKQTNPHLSPRQIRNLLMETSSMTKSNETVGGLINASAAVRAAVAAHKQQNNPE